MDENYGERYCAYLDVLGFRGLIADLGRGAISVVEMRELLTIVHEPSGTDHEHWRTKFRSQSISDAVAISTAVSRHGLVEILRAPEVLTGSLLRRGFFLRGALVKGSLYHDDKMIFGDALVRAYQLESELVRFPRVMVTRDVLLDYQRYIEEEGDSGSLANWLKQAADGPWFVHTLRATEMFVWKTLHENVGQLPGHASNLRDYASVQDLIQERLDASIDNPQHFEKVLWFADYWNRSMPYGLFGKKIVGPRLNQITWTADAPQAQEKQV